MRVAAHLSIAVAAMALSAAAASAQQVRAGADFRANTYTQNIQRRPDVVFKADGDFVVTWMGANASDPAYGIFGQRYDATGAAQGGEFHVNTFTPGYQFRPVAAADKKGNFVVVWSSAGQDGDGYGVFARRFAADGTPRGGEFQVNSYTTGSQGSSYYLVEQNQDALIVTQRPQILKEAPRYLAHSPLTHDRLDQDACRDFADHGFHLLDVASLDLIKAIRRRAKAFKVLCLASGCDGGQRAAMKGAFERDDAIALRRTVLEVVAARSLDGALHRLGAGIGEENIVCKGCVSEAFGKPRLLGDLMQVGDVPQLLCLLRQCLNQMRMRVPKRRHRHAAREVEIAFAGGGVEIGAFPAREGELAASIGRKEGRHLSVVSLK